MSLRKKEVKKVKPKSSDLAVELHEMKISLAIHSSPQFILLKVQGDDGCGKEGDRDRE